MIIIIIIRQEIISIIDIKAIKIEQNFVIKLKRRLEQESGVFHYPHQQK